MSGIMRCTWDGGRTRKSLCRPVEHSGGAAGAKPLAFLLAISTVEADVRGEGYDLILRSGWQDTYRLARQRDDGYTVVQAIDAGGMLRTRLPKNALTRSGAPRRCRCTAAGWYSAENRSSGLRPCGRSDRSRTIRRESRNMQRSAGILLPISSLPSPYGIGCFSQEAYDL